MPLAIYNNIMEIALGKLIPAELKLQKDCFVTITVGKLLAF